MIIGCNSQMNRSFGPGAVLFGVQGDGAPVNTSQVWAAFFRHPEVFVRDGKLIRLMF